MKKFFRFMKETIVTVGLAIILSLVLRAYVVEGRVIPSGSMLPTIKIEDRVLVNKFVYDISSPERGDIIVFSPPASLGAEYDFIKRVVGLPGETIEITDGTVYVNGQHLEEDYIEEKPNYCFGPVRVPDNALFVLGDNRNKSFDSHAWGSWLTIDNVKGKAFLRYWPLDRFSMLP